MILKPFQPIASDSFFVANATSAAGGAIPDSAEQVELYNSSATATAFWVCQALTLPSDTGPTALAPTTANPGIGGMPIPPGQRSRLTVGYGPKKFSVIATAADGNLYITPGFGI